VTLAISDVPGDDPAAIASGPTVADPTTLAEAREVIARHGIRVSPQVHAYLSQAESETCKPGTLPPADYRLIATPLMALQKCASRARELGLNPLILGDALEGESREMGIFMAGIARSVKDHGLPVKPPAVLLSGGETTVTIGAGGAGRGGRNCEFLLSLTIDLRGEADIFAIAGDTDGIDGTEDAAGAIVTPNSLLRALANGIESRLCLKKHDSYSLFDRVGDLIRTGPTLTNVNDFRAILVIPKG
jgi:hydroxypyruvate reductase